MNLYELTQEFIDIRHELEQAEGELTPELAEKLELNSQNFKDKATNYLRVISNISSDIAAINEEVARLNKLKKSKTNAIERLGTNLKNYMVASGSRTVDLGIFNLSLRRSESVEILNVSEIPANFVRVIAEPNKVAIKDFLKNGNDVPWARINVNESLQIR